MMKDTRTMAQRAMDRYTVGGHADGQFWRLFIAVDGYDAEATARETDSGEIALYTDGSVLLFWDEDDETKVAAFPSQIGVPSLRSFATTRITHVVRWNGANWEPIPVY